MTIGWEHSRIWRTPYDVRLGNAMTLQLGFVAKDGIVLASDRLLQHIEYGARSVRLTSKLLSGDGVICCWSGDMVAERTANAIRDVKWSPDAEETVRSKFKDIAKSIWDQTTSEFGILSPGVVREVIVALFSSQLWLVQISSQPFANKCIDKVVAGDVHNTCRHFFNNYAADCNQQMSVKELIGLAAYTILTAGEENPHGVNGLEIVVIPSGSEPIRLTPEHENALEDRFRLISSCIQSQLTEPFEFE